jgi:hypothetical protein
MRDECNHSVEFVAGSDSFTRLAEPQIQGARRMTTANWQSPLSHARRAFGANSALALNAGAMALATMAN